MSATVRALSGGGAVIPMVSCKTKHAAEQLGGHNLSRDAQAEKHHQRVEGQYSDHFFLRP